MAELTEADKKRVKPVLQKMAAFCAYRECTKLDVLQKLKKFPLSGQDQNHIVERLISDGFLNEERYVTAFINDKLRLDKWGPVKISYALKQKQIDLQTIESGLQRIDPKEIESVLFDLMKKKASSLHDIPVIERKQKLGRFLLQRGFESAQVWRAVESQP